MTTETKPYAVIDVADVLLKSSSGLGKALSPMALNKLAYIAHGWHLGLTKMPLFYENVEAWKYGPVIPVLYRITKGYGRSDIPPNFLGEGPNPRVSQSDAEYIASVASAYQSYSAIDLSAMTHAPGTPWTKIYAGEHTGTVIPNDLIAQHYQNLSNERPSETA